MSWNLLNGGEDGGDRSRVELQRAVIAETDPDVLLVQEARGFLDRGQRRRFDAERQWGLRGFLGPAGLTGQHTGVFIRPGLLPLSFRSDAAHFHHVPAILTLDIGTASPVTFASVHLCPDHPDARRLEAARLAGLLGRGRTVVIGGDFNAPSPDDPPVDLSTLAPHHRVHYVDASGDADRSPTALVVAAGLRELRGDDSPTVPTAGYPETEFVPFRADHLFATADVRGRSAQVLVDDRTNDASDHYPLVVTVEIG